FEGLAPPPREPSPGAERNADRESPWRALEPLRVPQSRDARRIVDLRPRDQGSPSRAQRVRAAPRQRSPAAHSSSHEAGGGEGSSGARRADDPLRSWARGTPPLRRDSRLLSKVAQRRDRGARPRTREDPDPRGASPPEADRLSSRFDRPEETRSAQLEGLAPSRQAARRRRRGAQGARS